MKFSYSIAAIAAALMLQGCAMAPGMRAQESDTAEVEPGNVVRIVPITTALLYPLMSPVAGQIDAGVARKVMASGSPNIE